MSCIIPSSFLGQNFYDIFCETGHRPVLVVEIGLYWPIFYINPLKLAFLISSLTLRPLKSNFLISGMPPTYFRVHLLWHILWKWAMRGFYSQKAFLTSNPSLRPLISNFLSSRIPPTCFRVQFSLHIPSKWAKSGF